VNPRDNSQLKIFAIRDRLLDYYQAPMAQMRSSDLVAAIANQLNNPETAYEINQAPEQFEVWQLGYVTDDGHLVPDRVLVCNCAQLIRASVWHKRTGSPAAAPEPTPNHGGAHSGTGANGGPGPSPVQGEPQATPGAGQARSTATAGGNSLRD